MANEVMTDADRERFLARFVAAKSLKGLRVLAREAKSFIPEIIEPIDETTEPAEVLAG